MAERDIAKLPLVIDMVCGCTGRLSIEYNTDLTDTFKSSHRELLELANAWVKAHSHCQSAGIRMSAPKKEQT